MTTAIIIREHGGPEVLTVGAQDVPPPGEGEIGLRQTAVAVNFHDTYVRSGLYKTLKLPGVPGLEGVGVITALGKGVTGFAVGDRVAYMTLGYGGYAAARNLQAGMAVKIPANVDDVTAGAAYLKGLTVACMVRNVHKIAPGKTVLVHAAAGGVGSLLVQWAKHLGATVIGTAGSTEKLEAARRSGCAHVINYREQDFVAAVRELTGGRGVDVVYDGVGRDTFKGSLEALALCGHLINFGQASGPVDPVAPTELFVRSATLSRPNVFHYVQQQRATLENAAAELFRGLAEGWLRIPKPALFPLTAAADAHKALESRAISGSIVLQP
ncbi:MAG: quinone oxidoreductase [Rhodospirillaceae bacterium]|nr:quinone oxidoreductase [Rhodospirillaceae bacterium]